MAAKLLFSHPADNLIASATPSAVAGTVDSLYPLENLGNGNPALPCKFTTLQGRIVFDFGSAVSVPLPALIHHNLTVAARWEANATNSWGSPSLSVAFPVATLDTDGYRSNLHLDVSAATGYGAYRYWSVVVDTDNAAALVLGELWLGSTIRDVTHNYIWGLQRTDQPPGRSKFTTRGGVEWVHAAIGRRRGLTATFETTDAGLAILRAWNLACGGMDQPTLLVPGDPDTADAWLARWTVDWAYKADFLDDSEIQAGWLELARGPAL
jgi:hypothetical protein